MQYDFDTVLNRNSSRSVKWSKYSGRDIIPLWLADMDFRASPEIVERISRDVEHGIFGYAKESEELVEAITARMQENWNWKVQPEWIVWLPSARTGMYLAAKAACKEDESVVTAKPVYPPFLGVPKSAGRELHVTELIVDKNGWRLDYDAIERAANKDNAKLFLLCNPHNPVGRIYNNEELNKLLDICLSKDMIICSDELHSGIIIDDNKKHLPIATLSEKAEQNSITILGPGKNFNLAGLCCSFAIIPNDNLRRKFNSSAQGWLPDVPLPGFSAALAAYGDSTKWLEECLTYLRNNHKQVFNFVNDELPGLSMHAVEATYLAWIDTRESGMKNPTELFEKYGVGLSEGALFGNSGFVRLNFACPNKTLTEALERMSSALKSQ